MYRIDPVVNSADLKNKQYIRHFFLKILSFAYFTYVELVIRDLNSIFFPFFQIRRWFLITEGKYGVKRNNFICFARLFSQYAESLQ